MKMKQSLMLAIAFLFVFSVSATVSAQTAKDFKITAIKLVPFDQTTGKFQTEITEIDERSFFNELSLGMFVTIEISGESGAYSDTRKVEVTVMEGKKVKTKKLEAVGIVGEAGKYYVPLYLDSAMCDEITVKARLIGQKTASTMTRKAAFMCGE